MSDIDTLVGLRESFKPKGYAHQRWATEEEVRLLYTITDQNHVKRVVEIGTANGYTAAAFALAGAEVFTFDIADRPKMYLDRDFPFPGIPAKIHFSLEASPGCLAKVPLTREQTLYFVDADHTYAGAKADSDAVLKLAKPGDLVVHHDATGETGSRRVWNEVVKMNLGYTHLYTTRNGVGLLHLGR